MRGTIAGQATGNIPNKLPNKLWMQHPVISNTCWEVYLHIKTDSHTTTDTMNIYVKKLLWRESTASRVRRTRARLSYKRTFLLIMGLHDIAKFH